MRVLAPLLAAAAAAARLPGSPYPESPLPASDLFLVDDSALDADSLIVLETLGGGLARRGAPRLYRSGGATDPYQVWLDALDVSVNASLQDSPAALVAELLQGAGADGYVLCDAGNASVNAALTLVAGSDAFLLAATEASAAALLPPELPLAADVRALTPADVFAGVADGLSTSVVNFQDASKAGYLAEYAVFARAATQAFDSAGEATAAALAHLAPGAAAFGWGAEDAFVGACAGAGAFVHASDWAKNLAALSNAGPSGALPAEPLAPVPETDDRHTVAFLMTDGDNLQWLLGGWFTDEAWFGSAARGGVRMGWTLSPALAELAPAALSVIGGAASANDSFVAAPSGLGYTYMDQQSDPEGFAALTGEYMRAAGLAGAPLNVLGFSDDDAALAPLAALDEVSALFYYPFDDYAGLHGAARELNGTAVIGARFALWGDADSGDLLGVDGLVSALQQQSKDAGSVDGYSLVAVHAWTHTVADVAAVVAALEAAGGFAVVSPGELAGLQQSKDAGSVDGYSLVAVHAWTHTVADVAVVVAALEAGGVSPGKLAGLLGGLL